MKHLIELKNDNELVLGLTADITTVSIDGTQVYPTEAIEPEPPVDPIEPPVEDKTPPTYKLKEELQHG